MTENEGIVIHTIPIAPMGLINAFLIQKGELCILVDAGLPKSERKILNHLNKLNLGFNNIKLIIITHAHIDHAGNAATLKELTGAPILAHSNDLAYYLGNKEMTFCSTGWFGTLFKKTGAIQKPYEPFRPNILLNHNEHYELTEFGINGQVLSTPGHTEGSVSVIIEDEHAIVGDLISSGVLLGGIIFRQTPKRPPFEQDPKRVARSLAKLCHEGVSTYYMGHGGPLTSLHIKKHISKLEKL